MEQPNSHIKRCRICGDTAIGFNFNVISCESCKSFFRRNVFHQHKFKFFKCPFGDKCRITQSNRNDCKSCRLKKCLEIGMKKDLLFSRYNNRLTCEQNDENQTDKCEQILQIYKNETDLKGHELARLQKVRSAVKVIHDEEDLPVSGVAENMIQLVSLDACSINRVVKCCSRFVAFKNLEQRDQITLLNRFYSGRAFVQGAFLFDLDKDGCYRVKVENTIKAKSRVLVKSSLIQECTDSESFQIYQNFTHSLYREMENDPTIYDLLLTQLLFQHHENTSKSEYIRYNHILYRYLLRRYLENKYSSIERAKVKFTALMAVVDQVEDVHQVFKSIYHQIIIQRDRQSQQVLDAMADIYENLNTNFKLNENKKLNC